MILAARSSVLAALALSFLFAATPALAQDAGSESDAEGRPVEIGRRYTISSEILGEDRPLLIGLPAGYAGSDEPYPVVYVLDGQSHFHHTTGTVRFLAGNDRMPGAIVVAVGNISGDQRTRDMTPVLEGEGGSGPAAGDFPAAGGSEAFLRFLTEELRPWVDERYRTRSYDILIGHSFGGLFITDVLQRAPESFDGYISISPSLWWDDEAYVERIGDLFERHPDARGSLYMTMGSEGGNMLSGAWTFAGTLEKHAPADFRWHWNHMPAETHGSVPHRSTYDGLEWTFEGWDPTPLIMPVFQDEADPAEPLNDVAAHYAELSERFGWEIRPPAPLVSDLGEFLLNEGRTDHALEVFTRLVAWRPDEPLSHAGLAEALATACEWDDARTHLGHARQRAGDNERVLGLIEEQLAALEERAASGEGCGAAGN